MMWLRRLFCRHEFVPQHEGPTQKVLCCRRCGRAVYLEIECTHEWSEIGRTVTRPTVLKIRTGEVPAADYDSYMQRHFAIAQRAAFGSTTIIYRCEKCAKLRTVEAQGVPHDRLPEKHPTPG